jgi:acetyltransferase-like isoleucine patch superfamily enzyme
MIIKFINKISSLLFCSYASVYLKHCGKHICVGLNWNLTNPQYMSIGNNFCADNNLRLQCWPEYHGKPTGFNPSLIIGDNVSMISNCQISVVNKIEIGSGCLLGDNVFITDNSHGNPCNSSEINIPPSIKNLSTKGPVIVGKNCWIGRNVCIMSGVTIGDGCIIGANAVVTKNIDSYSVAVGIPAKVIKRLS